ncbi:nuclear pore complex protein Nup205-like isoform X2 [Apostichopus japonicus]|uniref:nuclear pore complex protein Nup205-like isoform X2 n=1 Tax=Stichopus japonicus TaxID=307972 RepID=UPI003AB7F11B
MRLANFTKASLFAGFDFLTWQISAQNLADSFTCNLGTLTIQIHMAENLGSKLWGPFKELFYVVDSAVSKKNPDAFNDLEAALRRHKPDFVSLLQNPAKNAQHREQLRKANTDGIQLDGETGPKTLPVEVIEEALIISDLFNLNEYSSVELLLAGEQEQPRFPGYSRGLVAVLLYYDGRASLLNSLQLLIQARKGRTWSFEIEEEITELATEFTDDLMKDGLTKKILTLLEKLDVVKELDKLSKEKALGDAKHRYDVTEFLRGIRTSLAESLFAWSCQTPLIRQDLMLLFNHLRKHAAVDQTGCLDEVTIALSMSYLYSIDISNVEPRDEDRDELAKLLPLLQDPQYLPDLHQLVSKDTDASDMEAWKGLKTVLEFGMGITLRRATQQPETQEYQDILERDEVLVDNAIQNNLFRFINNCIFQNKHFFQVEFYVRQFHSLFTDFITQMPLKLKDLRNRGDEAGRIILAHEREGLEPPENLPRYFEDLLKLLGTLYGRDDIGLELSNDYWNAPDRAGSPQGGGSYLSLYAQKMSPKQMALFKFVRMAGDLLPPSLYVPYLEMLRGLSNGKQSASCCFNLLKMNGTGGGGGGSVRSVSWDHFFGSFNRYFSSLRQDMRPESPFQDPNRTPTGYNKGITPQELDGLIAVLKLTQTVASWSEEARIQLYENQSWLPTILLFGLLTCSVPLQLKAECLKTLAVFAKSPEVVMSLWQALETSQIIPTVAHHGAAQAGIPVELEEIESRNEQYPMTLGFLRLMSALTKVPVPPGLGAGYRAPGFDPYLEFLRDNVLLCFQARSYKDKADKWEVACLVTEVFYQLLRDHQPQASDFMDQPVELQGGGTTVANKPAGHHLLVHLLNDGDLLRLLLSILDEAAILLNRYTPFAGKEYLQESALNCLKLLDLVLDKQDLFIDLLRNQGMATAILATPLDQLLMSINTRSRKADHLVNITQLVVFGSLLPEHALYALRVLYKVVRSSNIQPEIVNMFSTDKGLFKKLLHGFVECLDADESEKEETDDEELSHEGEISLEELQSRHICEARITILKLLIHSLSQPGPNLAHLFLGYNLRKPVSKTEIQDPGIWGSPRTCLHAILGILSRDLSPHRGPSTIVTSPQLAELAYELVYMLTADRDTSGPTMRYLRGTRDYFYRHLRHVPFNKHSENEREDRLRLNQQAWLLKAVAVELRMTAINRQRSHVQRLIKLLLENTPSHFIEEDDKSTPSQLHHSLALAEQSAIGFDPGQDQDVVVQGLQIRRKILSILDSIDLSLDVPGKLDLEVIDNAMAEQVIAGCETRNEQGVVLCNLKLLHRILTAELNNLQGSSALGQRSRLEEEVGIILRAAVERNVARLTLKSRRHAFDAWRQVVEVLLTSCSEEILPNDVRQMVTIELLQELLAKVLDEDASSELTSPVAGNLLSLTTTLRQCVAYDQSQIVAKMTSPNYARVSDQSILSGRGSFSQKNEGSLDIPIVSLTGILRDLLRFLLLSGGSHQLVRANLYGALLNYLQIPYRPPNASNVRRSTMFFQPPVSEEFEKIMAASLAVIEEFGEPLCSLICRDACEGQEVGRTLALSVLSAVLSSDKRGGWLSFFTSRGYLRHFVESVAQADNELQEALQLSPEPLRAVYIYESTMSFLTVVAEDPVGAKALLEVDIMNKLSQVQFLDLRPDREIQLYPAPGSSSWDQYEQEESFVPTVMSRYRQLFFPVLRLCQAMLTSLGSHHNAAVHQVLNLVVSHADVFTAILREPVLSFKAETLQELSLVTCVLGSVVGGVDYFDPSLSETSGPNQIPLQTHVTRLHRELLALVPRYCAIESWSKELKLRDSKRNQDHPSNKEELRRFLLEITANLVGYCRTVIVRSGTTAADCQILFTPSMVEATGRDNSRTVDLSFANLDVSKPPSLGIIVRYLRQTSHEFLICLEKLQQLQNKMENISNLPTEEVKELALQSTVIGKETINTKQRLQLATKTIGKMVRETSLHLALLYYGLESSLFLVWRHLEYYFLHCHPSLVGNNAFPLLVNRRPPRDLVDPLSSLLDDTTAPAVNDTTTLNPELLGITKEDLQQLKIDSVACLKESFLKRVLDVETKYSPMRRFRYAFVSAMVRRIRRLLIVDLK